MKKILLLISIVLVSCNQICEVIPVVCWKNSSIETKVDLSTIDQYPMFENCNHLLDHKAIKTCFQETVYQKLTDGVDSLQLSAPKNINETIHVAFTVNKKGIFICNDIKASPSLKKQIPHLKDSIQKAFKLLEKVSPAQKRGIPVTAKFKIPLEIVTK